MVKFFLLTNVIALTSSPFYEFRVSSLQFPTRSRWFQHVSGGSRLYQLVSNFNIFNYEAQIKSKVLPFRKNVKETSNSNQIYSFLLMYSGRTSIFDYFKLRIQACMFFITEIVKICSMSCWNSPLCLPISFL